MKHYYEVTLERKQYLPNGEVQVMGGMNDNTILIIGESKPSIKEAEAFLKEDLKSMGFEHALTIYELSKEDAYESYFIDENALPIFK